MKFRWSDEKCYAYEFECETSDGETFERALNIFRMTAVVNPAVKKPFSAHLHYLHKNYGWGQLKPPIALSERQNINDWTAVYQNALRANEYADRLHDFAHNTVADMIRDGEINEMRKKYQAGEF